MGQTTAVIEEDVELHREASEYANRLAFEAYNYRRTRGLLPWDADVTHTNWVLRYEGYKAGVQAERRRGKPDA